MDAEASFDPRRFYYGEGITDELSRLLATMKAGDALSGERFPRIGGGGWLSPRASSYDHGCSSRSAAMPSSPRSISPVAASQIRQHTAARWTCN